MPELRAGQEIVAVVAASPDELAPLARRAGFSGRSAALTDGRPPVRGRIAGIEVVLTATGMGRRNAERGLAALLERHRPTRVLALGLAGALSDELESGDLLVAGEVLAGEQPVPGPDHDWLASAQRHEGCRIARMVTVDEILSSPAAKSRWLERVGSAPPEGGSTPVAVDMESAAYARVASAAGLPYLVVRAVSDRADEALPAFFERCRRSDGDLDRRRILGAALLRPGAWPALVRLSSRMTGCALRLADLGEAILADLAAGSGR